MSEVYADHPFQLLTTPTYQLHDNEKPNEFVNATTHMALAHNMMIRSLNAMYLQAPHISPEQARPFLQFAELWCKVVEHHHRTEEDIFFPMLEEMTGEKDIMKANSEQHDAFQSVLGIFAAYIRQCLSRENKYNGTELIRIFDGFAPVLWQHLSDEIPTLIALEQYWEKVTGFHAKFAAEVEKTQQELGVLAGAVFVIATHDVEYEGGIHVEFPPIPSVITWGLRNVAWWAHHDWWYFAPCDRSGKMRQLNILVD
ncbi:hemerythrin HHE cation binding domain-containing protein [Xylariaceae sp. AK1471]|nr:hemerythrin HHE cation binding domain-containing protein [Xylariaceae sp. AK1471]